jgi:hypothetical protein
MSLGRTEKLVLDSALERVLDHARKLADIDEDGDGEKSYYHALQQVAQQLSGLTSSIRDYDKLVEVIKEQQEQEDGT